MRILHTVESYLPAVHGMQEVLKQISERLNDFGHEVVIATKFDPKRKLEEINGIKIEQFKISGNEVLGYDGDEQEIKRYQNFLLNNDFDVITNFAAQQWATDLSFPMLNKIKAKKVFVPTGFSTLYSDVYKDYFEKMKNRMKLYDMNVFLSDDYRDINFAKQNNVEKRVLIPNGADEREFLSGAEVKIRKYLGIPAKHLLILHVGSHSGVKGHYESIKIFQKAKIKNATFLMVSNGTDGCYPNCKKSEKIYNWSYDALKNNKRIRIRRLSRDLTVDAYKAADLFLFPSNIECSPIVTFEACASRTPFLATEVGNIKEQIQWTKGGVLLPTIKGIEFNRSFEYKIRKFIKKILKFANVFKGTIIHIDYSFVTVDIDESAKLLEKLFYNKKLREELRQQGFLSWQEKFTWEKIAKDYEKLYLDLLNN